MITPLKAAILLSLALSSSLSIASPNYRFYQTLNVTFPQAVKGDEGSQNENGTDPSPEDDGNYACFGADAGGNPSYGYCSKGTFGGDDGAGNLLGGTCNSGKFTAWYFYDKYAIEPWSGTCQSSPEPTYPGVTDGVYSCGSEDKDLNPIDGTCTEGIFTGITVDAVNIHGVCHGKLYSFMDKDLNPITGVCQ